MKSKTRPCNYPPCRKPYEQYNSLVGHCSDECRRLHKAEKDQAKAATGKTTTKNKIASRSEKGKALDSQYKKIRIEVLSEAKFVCFVDGCARVATTCEHQRGRVGFADEWAKENNIPLLIDKRFLKPCCLHHNLEFERNPELSKKYQLSKIHGGAK